MINPYSACGKYIFDLSIERNFIENSFKQTKDFIPNIRYYLIVLNADYIYDGKEINGKKVYDTDESGNELFRIYDLTYVTELAQEEVTKKQKQIYKYLNDLTFSDDRLSESCEYKKTTQCKFFNVCYRHVKKDGSILEYLGKLTTIKTSSLVNFTLFKNTQ